MKNKVSILLVGGIGNNLFQIATAYAYSLRHNKELVLLKVKYGTVHGALHMYDTNLLSRITYIDELTYNQIHFKTYNEPSFEYAEIPFIEGDVLLNGYFQSAKYFEDFRKEIIDLFSSSFRSQVIEKYRDILKFNTCSIHCRRGDYLLHPNQHPVQNLNYFMKAIRQMPDDSVFLVFSDDIQWCKDNFPAIPEKFKFIEGNADYEDLTLMSLCENNIIANSSFSWWGAYLNQNETSKKVIPDKWFGKDIPHNTKDIYCNGWIRI